MPPDPPTYIHVTPFQKILATAWFDQCSICCIPEEGPDRTEKLQEKFDQCNSEALLRICESEFATIYSMSIPQSTYNQ